MAYQTNSFSIAHYILLISMVVLCGGVVAYAIIHDTGRYEDILPTEHAQSTAGAAQEQDTCAQTVTNAVAQMWAYNPDVIPEKYKNIAMAYFTAPMETTVSGECNGARFVCRQGARRADCNPCAASEARDFAIAVQTRDMIKKHCGE
ncbi:MAG: hypothetical protein K2I81_02825 [Alphaproteobacteria bacterium]|nr:hypothetical protein [Alphaproteobacteria bacterium]